MISSSLVGKRNCVPTIGSPPQHPLILQLIRAQSSVRIMQIVNTSKTSSCFHRISLAPKKYSSGIKNMPPKRLIFPISPLSRNANTFTLRTPAAVWSSAIGSNITGFLIESRSCIFHNQAAVKAVPKSKRILKACSSNQSHTFVTSFHPFSFLSLSVPSRAAGPRKAETRYGAGSRVPAPCWVDICFDA